MEMRRKELEVIRKSLNVSQYKLSAHTGIPRAAIQLYEQGFREMNENRLAVIKKTLVSMGAKKSAVETIKNGPKRTIK